MQLEFEWDERKATGNRRKHGVSFHERSTVLGDPLSWTFPDPDQSADEERSLTIGLSARGRVIVVSHTERGNRTRIISARPATSRERHDYEEG